ncbi:MAG: Septum formation initiator [Parcubacteria group bacterium GW2011_GWB1_50_9]|uniref:Septum formation initiator n=2 Tax=Parcubacteria group TaxID=1794811 RepID=A0A0G1WSD5_9BACT|nr:MAG: Septum formation initiator [Parcubacteria group bacterium GW2011_GWB1_50_9]KKW21500.1 MAG: Septum formation initiator [Candidatus Adlerbacteria bacterium GW2011_GWC1_50_9]KKW33749.1 MAG: Septum formation initiator [Parcubacteria group bacterium GW2011_GWA1_53_13]
MAPQIACMTFFFPNIGVITAGFYTDSTIMNRHSPVKKFLRVGILFAAFSLFAWGGYNKAYQAFTTFREKRARDERLLILEERSNALGEELQKFDNTAAIEREAKERFNLKRPGEKVVVILSDERSAETKAGENPSLWARVWDALKAFFK